MKRFVTLICIVLTTLAGWAQNNKIVNRTEGSITFTVDENLAPISENALTIEEFMTDGSRALGKFGIFQDEGVPGDTKKWVAKSFSDEEKFYIFKGKDVFFQTIVLDMAGNSGTQSLAVTIRLISTNEISKKQVAAAIFKELRVGLINGLILGVLSFTRYMIYIEII